MQTAKVVPSPSPFSIDRAAAKQALRRELRVARRDYVANLAAGERERLEAVLLEVLLPEIAGKAVLAGYSPMGSEIDPTMLLRHAGDASITTAYPAFVTKDAPMIFRSGQCAEGCPVGGVQPPGQAKTVEPDLVLVPLLAVDRAGNRLGQGGGHYDRALPALRAAGARLIGIGWAMQLIDMMLPPDPWDVPLDAFASPDGLVEFA